MSELVSLQGLDARFLQSTIEDDPVKWAKDVLEVDLWSKQREIMRLLEHTNRVAVPSTHGIGKSFTASVATARFLAKHPPGTARVVTTAPTNTQVKAVLWNEINQLHSRAEGRLPGRVNQTEWWIGPYLAAFGRKPSDYASSTFQGIHAEHILIILDEADAIPADLWTQVEVLATNSGAKILAIGNPVDPQSIFAKVITESKVPKEDGRNNGWHVVHVPAWETPNLSGEVVPASVARSLITAEFVEARRREWGEDSALWKARIAAVHPDESEMTVVRLADVEAALRGLDDDEGETVKRRLRFEDVQLGIDIAASERGDETVIRERRGKLMGRRWSIRSSEPEEISDLIVLAQAQSGASLLHIDATGVGFGFLGDIKRRIPGVHVAPFYAAASAEDTKQFTNRRSEAHWYMRELLRHRGIDFSDMDNASETTTQLMAIRYSIAKGKIQVELKDEIRKRLGRSPDDSDALLLAALPPSGTTMPATATAHAATKGRAVEKIRAEGADAPEMVIPGPRAVMPKELPPSRYGIRGRRRSFTLHAR